MNNLYWFYDVFIVGILIISLYVGAKRGFLKSAVFTVLVIVSFFASWLIAEAGSPFIYDNFIKDSVTKSLVRSVENKDPSAIVSKAVSNGDYGVEMSVEDIDNVIVTGDDFFNDLAKEMRKNGSPESSENISEGVEKSVTPVIIDTIFDDVISSDYIKNALNTVGGAAQKMKTVVSSFITGTESEVAKAAEENLVAPVLKWLIRAILFVFMMGLFRLIIGPISDAFKIVNKIPIVGPVNVLLGSVLGVIEGVIALIVIALGIKAFINITGNSLIFFNTQTIDLTNIFKQFYNFDIMSLLR